MATFKKSQKETWLTCPYDPSHKLPSSRSLVPHLLQCERTHPGWLKCPYNDGHRFPTQRNLDLHVVRCPNMGQAVREQYERDTAERLANLKLETVEHQVYNPLTSSSRDQDGWNDSDQECGDGEKKGFSLMALKKAPEAVIEDAIKNQKETADPIALQRMNPEQKQRYYDILSRNHGARIAREKQEAEPSSGRGYEPILTQVGKNRQESEHKNHAWGSREIQDKDVEKVSSLLRETEKSVESIVSRSQKLPQASKQKTVKSRLACDLQNNSKKEEKSAPISWAQRAAKST